MRKFRLGFTLTEVLLALAIIGISAALTIPMVVNNAQKHQSGAILARAISQIELGCQDLIQLANQNKDYGSYTNLLSVVSETEIGYSNKTDPVLGANFIHILPLFCNINYTPKAENNVLDIRSFDNNISAQDISNVNKAARYAFKDFPAHIAIFRDFDGNLLFRPDQPTGYMIYIDTNGWNKAPNVNGKDVFAFELLNEGSLRPAPGFSEAGRYAAQVIKDNFKIKYY